jgi:hypothetical protein
MPSNDDILLRPVAPGVALPPPVSLLEVKESKHEQALAPIKGLVTSAAAVGPGITLMHAEGLGGDLLRGVSKYGGGVAIEPTPKGPRPVIGKFSFATFLLPAPAGIVPPELMQIQPSWLQTITPNWVPGQELAGIKASSARERVFESERAERAIIHAVLQDYTYPGTPQDLAKFTTDQLAAMRDFLKTTSTTQARSPAALNALNAELLSRPYLALPSEDAVSRIPSPTEGPLGLLPSPNGTQAPAFSGQSVFGQPFGIGSFGTLPPLIPQPVANISADKIEPSNTRQQEAKKRAPTLLKGILSESADP